MYIQMCRLTDEIMDLFILIIQGLNPYWISRGELFIKRESSLHCSPPAVFIRAAALGGRPLALRPRPISWASDLKQQSQNKRQKREQTADSFKLKTVFQFKQTQA